MCQKIDERITSAPILSGMNWMCPLCSGSFMKVAISNAHHKRLKYLDVVVVEENDDSLKHVAG